MNNKAVAPRHFAGRREQGGTLAVEVTGLTKRYRHRAVLGGLDLQVERATICDFADG